jgi:hypothetical protein
VAGADPFERLIGAPPARARQQAAADHDGLEVGFKDQSATELLHQDHRRHRIQARSADAFRKRHCQNAKVVGESGPNRRSEAGRRLNRRAPLLETV